MQLWRNRVGVWVFVGVLLLSSAAAWGAGSYLQASDWQYQELDKLSQAGLLTGHPQAPLSTWTDKLSRYEAAALTLRAVEAMGQVYEAQGQKLRQLAQANDPGAATGAPATSEPTGPDLSSEDLLRVQKLVQEFRTELVGMGERLDELDQSLKLMLGVVDEIQKNLATVSADQKKHKIDGYAQVRYRHDTATDGRTEFQVRRVRVNLRGPVSPRVSYRVEAQFDSKESVASVDFANKKTSAGGPGSKAQLRTATLDYLFPTGLRARMGQLILPWGYELEESVPDIWTGGERSFFMDRLFPDQRDIGLTFNWRPRLTGPLYDLGFVNGRSINAVDNNNHTNVLGRVMVNIPYGTAALSGYAGTDKEGLASTRQDRYGIGSRLAYGDWKFLGEGVIGHDRGADVSGMYAQLGRPVLKNASNLLFAKYDTYDENRDLPNDAFRRLSLGYWYDLDSATRLTLWWESRDPGTAFSDLRKWDGNGTFFQWQVKF